MRFIRFVTGLVGLAAVVAAVPVLVTGLALFSWSASDSSTTLPTVAVSSTDRAVVANDIDAFAGERRMFLPEVDLASLRVSDDQPVFVGIGPSRQVKLFLAAEEGAPNDEAFWARSAEGTTAAVEWQIEPGQTAVVMNADGAAGVAATLQASVPSGPLRLAGGILVVVGVGIGIVGALLVGAAWGGRRSGRPTSSGVTAAA